MKRSSGTAVILRAVVVLSVAVFTFLLSTSDAFAAETDTTSAIKQVFDASYYAGHNPDVVLAKGDSYDALLAHYMEHGIYEGRSASAAFNASSYRSRYADLNAAYGDDMPRYAKHYVAFGVKEGRDASAHQGVTSQPASAQTPSYVCIGTYTTRYTDNIPRAANVRIAASGINGVVVKPGAEFSFTNTIPARTVENGYQMATVFLNKEKVQGLGGGICQVSSTLYAAMLTAGLPATERHPHSLPVDYLPAGWDATISGQAVDLKFVNIYETPLMISAQASGGNLTVSLYLQS